LWDTTTSGRSRASLKEHKSPVLTLAYSPDGSFLASGSGSERDGTNRGELLLWDARKGKVLSRFSCPAERNSVAFSPDGRTLAAVHNLGGVGKEINLWEVPTGRRSAHIPFPVGAEAVSVAFSSQRTMLIVGQIGGKISLCDSTTGQISETRSGHPADILSPGLWT
jgi:WD40 repeat protein